MKNDFHLWSNRIPGKRTARDLAVAAIPARLIVVMALFALCAAVAISLAAKALALVGLMWLSAKATQYTATFEAMPLWVLIGGSMSQVAARVCTAWDDVRAWRARQSTPVTPQQPVTMTVEMTRAFLAAGHWRSGAA